MPQVNNNKLAVNPQVWHTIRIIEKRHHKQTLMWYPSQGQTEKRD